MLREREREREKGGERERGGEVGRERLKCVLKFKACLIGAYEANFRVANNNNILFMNT